MTILDFHIHSKYSRSCSKQLDLEHIELWSHIKGIDIIACGDFTHPEWFKEIKEKLEPQGNGLFRLNSREITKAVREDSDIKVFNPRGLDFILSTEVACIYRQDDVTRRIHINVLFPKISDVEKFIKELEKRGAKLASDGRPILGMSTKNIAEICLSINEQALIVPSHVWTPWFALFGSKSGFDSVEECFGEYSKYIYALETGLSSDPSMNWRISKNDKYTLVSNSDAHSLQNLGREANVLDLSEVSYDQIYETLKQGDTKRFQYTIEFFPEEGKYHLDGHSNCGFSCMPEETKRLGGRCPNCGKKITVGVHSRIAELADNFLGRKPENKIPYKSIVPLQEIIADALGVGKNSKKVLDIYQEIINNIGNEFFVLLEADIDSISKFSSPMIALGVQRVREGNVKPIGGYDGNFGIVQIFSNEERADYKLQRSLL